MGRHNVLVEGVSGTGKTTVAEELQRRGHQVVHGDRELAYQGDPETGEPTDTHHHEHHIWDVATVRALVADDAAPVTFFCGGARNHPQLVELFDTVVVLEVDLDTLHRRLDARPDAAWGGGEAVDRELIVGFHATGADTPSGGVRVDATAPVADVVEAILRAAALPPADPVG